MATIFPVGSKNKWDWFPKLAQDLGMTEGTEGDDPVNQNYEAVKDLPMVSVSVSDEGLADETGAPVESALPEITPVAPEASPVSEPAVPAAEAASIVEVAENVAEAVGELAKKLEDVASTAAVAAKDAEKDEKADKKDEPKKEDCPTPPCDSKEEKKDEPKAEEKKDDAPKAPEAKEASASQKTVTAEYVRLSHTTPETKSEIRSYWLALGFPSEYVEAMTKDYDK